LAVKNIRPIRVYTFTVYGILSPRRVWCERTVTLNFDDK
jgi:hypothetical protein